MLRGHSKSILKACSDLDREVPLEVFVIEIFMWAGSERHFLSHCRDLWYRDWAGTASASRCGHSVWPVLFCQFSLPETRCHPCSKETKQGKCLSLQIYLATSSPGCPMTILCDSLCLGSCRWKSIHLLKAPRILFPWRSQNSGTREGRSGSSFTWDGK